MILYHFPTSPFARRVRLVLSLKGLTAELRDARGNPEHRDAVHRLNPLHTVPVLVDGERVVLDSTAICHYLDRKVPTPPLWPSGIGGAAAFEFVALSDAVVGILVDAGLRYHALHEDPAFPEVCKEMIGRAQRALDVLAEKVAARGERGVPLCGTEWGAADIAVLTTVTWLKRLPARAVTFPVAKQVVDLGWSLPAALERWAAEHESRADVLALD